MTAQTRRSRAPTDLNHLQRGSHYRATTGHGSIDGEYLGVETPFGDRAILLRRAVGTVSIAIGDLTSIRPLAA